MAMDFELTKSILKTAISNEMAKESPQYKLAQQRLQYYQTEMQKSDRANQIMSQLDPRNPQSVEETFTKLASIYPERFGGKLMQMVTEKQGVQRLQREIDQAFADDTLSQQEANRLQSLGGAATLLEPTKTEEQINREIETKARERAAVKTAELEAEEKFEPSLAEIEQEERAEVRGRERGKADVGTSAKQRRKEWPDLKRELYDDGFTAKSIQAQKDRYLESGDIDLESLQLRKGKELKKLPSSLVDNAITQVSQTDAFKQWAEENKIGLGKSGILKFVSDVSGVDLGGASKEKREQAVASVLHDPAAFYSIESQSVRDQLRTIGNSLGITPPQTPSKEDIRKSFISDEAKKRLLREHHGYK